MSRRKDTVIRELASAVSTAMFGLLYEGDYSPHNGPSEDELYDAALHAISRALERPELLAAVKRGAK